MILVSSEMPGLTRAIALLVAAHYPQEKIVFIHTLYIRNIIHDYPHNTKWSDYPLITEPKFKFNPWSMWKCQTLNSQNQLEDMILTDDMIDSITEVLYASDPMPYVAYTHTKLIEKFFSHPRIKKTAIVLMSLDNATITKALSEKGDFYKVYEAYIIYGQIKEYFNYNFNINSLAILGKTLKMAGLKEGFISKYMLQLLYFLDNHRPITMINIYPKMSNWSGTGKYSPKNRMGSSTSTSLIIENLQNLNLLEKTSINHPLIDKDKFKKMEEIYKESENTNYYLNVSEKGKCFLSLLHKDCKDLDLVFRINLWAIQDFDTAKPKIDSYLKNYFGKQKRKLSTLEKIK